MPVREVTHQPLYTGVWILGLGGYAFVSRCYYKLRSGFLNVRKPF